VRAPVDRSFLDLGEAELAAQVSAAWIAPAYRAGVLENLRTLQDHARRVADAIAAGAGPGPAAPPEPFRP
jgi:hypothetical protein